MKIELRRWKLTRRSTLEITRSESAGEASIEIVNTSKTNLENPIVDQPECTSLHASAASQQYLRLFVFDRDSVISSLHLCL